MYQMRLLFQNNLEITQSVAYLYHQGVITLLDVAFCIGIIIGQLVLLENFISVHIAVPGKIYTYSSYV